MIPVTKQLQILVSNSQLTITKDTLIFRRGASPKKQREKDKEEEGDEGDSDGENALFEKSGSANGIFKPAINGNARLLLYVKLTYRGIPMKAVFDPRTMTKLELPKEAE